MVVLSTKASQSSHSKIEVPPQTLPPAFQKRGSFEGGQLQSAAKGLQRRASFDAGTTGLPVQMASPSMAIGHPARSFGQIYQKGGLRALLPVLAQHPSAVHCALVAVQIFYGGYHVVTKLALKQGINQLVFCAYRDLIALSILGPAAYFLDKGKRPPFHPGLLLSFSLLGLTGIFGNQLLFMFGLHYTSPAIAAALQPSIPVLTFILAILTRSETLHWQRRDGHAKIAGITICVSGAVFMAIYKGPPLVGRGLAELAVEAEQVTHGRLQHEGALPPALAWFGLDMWHFGMLCLVGNCTCMAGYLALQARVLIKYPAALSLTAFGYLFGTVLMVLTGIVFAPDRAEWYLSGPETLAVLYAGIVASAVNYWLLTWANKRVGPSLVALYMPVQPLSSAILSGLFLGSSLFLGSVIGGTFILAGLYLVVWGRAEAEKLSGSTLLYKRPSSSADSHREDDEPSSPDMLLGSKEDL